VEKSHCPPNVQLELKGCQHHHPEGWRCERNGQPMDQPIDQFVASHPHDYQVHE
jgi:hypothetical protein